MPRLIGGPETKLGAEGGPRVSPDKVSRDSGVVSPSDGGSLVTDTSDGGCGGEAKVVAAETLASGGSVLTVHDTPSRPESTNYRHQDFLNEYPPRLNEFKLGSGKEYTMQPVMATRFNSPATTAGANNSSSVAPLPVKAELVTNELDDHLSPPPYHIAAARSKQAATFSVVRSNSLVSQSSGSSTSQHLYENQVCAAFSF